MHPTGQTLARLTLPERQLGEGPRQYAMTLEAGSADRLANMRVFADTALNFLLPNLSRDPSEQITAKR